MCEKVRFRDESMFGAFRYRWKIEITVFFHGVYIEITILLTDKNVEKSIPSVQTHLYVTVHPIILMNDRDFCFVGVAWKSPLRKFSELRRGSATP